jgi:hypothetical protein
MEKFDNFIVNNLSALFDKEKKLFLGRRVCNGGFSSNSML